jgi:cytochrome b6-f complex iron-sulfur subunit
MRLFDDLAVPENPREASRRQFLSVTTIAAVASALFGSVALTFRFLWPSVLFELPTRFMVGRLSDLDRKVMFFLRSRRLYLIRDERGVFAQSAVCTHLGCLTRANPREDGFFCPCHGSQFTLDGKVVSGPAPRSLEHFKIEREGERLWVDLAENEDADVRVQL